MTRMSKKSERRSRSPRKSKASSPKTGPKKDALPLGYKAHTNALSGQTNVFIAKVK